MTFTPTPEQLACIEAATSSEENLIISALAGAAKTSTLVMIAEALPTKRILCLAFNKKIADEMAERLPNNCESMTLNSLGFRVWKQVLGRGARIDKDKMYNILSELINALDPEEKKDAYENFADLSKTISFGKACGYIPDGYGRGAKPLMSCDEFFSHTEDKYADWEQQLIRDATRISLDQAWQGVMDFDDQILMPTIFNAAFPMYPVVLIDEAQDLSALNHATLRKLAKRRLIAVGDPCQAIYGFRGAHEESMDLLRKSFSMRELTLSVSFRCPIAVVEHARWRAPSMQYPSWASPGSVSEWTTWEIPDLPEECAIICRNNAPLFSLALKMLRAGRYAQILGNDIGKGLLKIMKKFGDERTSQDVILQRITEWEEAKSAKTRNKGPIQDRAACMRVFAMNGKNLGQAISYAEHIFNSHGPVKLLTGHKSKGLEFNEVFILEKDLIKDEGQDPNLRYVMITRAKQSLTYIDFDGLILPDTP